MAYRGHSSITIETLDTHTDNLDDVHKSSSIWHNVGQLFSVSNCTLPHRLLTSLVPPLGFTNYRNVYTDLKVPVLLVTALTATLMYGLSSSPGHHSTTLPLLLLLLTTIKYTLGYWLAFTALASVMGYLCSTRLTPIQLLSITGYSLTGHTLVLLIAELLHQEDNHTVFFILTTVFGGLATCRMMVVVLVSTPRPPHRLLLGSTLASIHLMHLVFIHFAFMRKKFVV
ncbi:hypothetical protein Pmani_007863 [Petrolisthes manimaculis]|uniref:Protein YIPF3 n=1 Tax=Petrolisthes manimaculis TaxID=1843537 RepID=A0AAE1Q9T5_9EUCA|nr:hypothetical protein Pmani_007863 [Petrolisthes manimaculis]